MNNEFLTIKQYEEIAKKILHKIHKPLYKDIIKDVEKFGEIVKALMIADWKFNGIGNKYGYRKQYIQWTIGKMYGKTKNQAKIVEDILPDGRNLLDNLLTEECIENLDYEAIDIQDELEKLSSRILNSQVLTTKEKSYLTDCFINKLEIADIAKKNNIYKKSVIAILKKGLLKLGLNNGNISRFSSGGHGRTNFNKRTVKPQHRGQI